MPFWWRRRNKNWYGRRFRYRYKRRWPKRRKRRRLYRRQRPRRTHRRRRRRRYKVRRKKQKIPVTQWQPDSIRKCKIKGLGTAVLGAEGTQMNCYTAEKIKYVPPKVPWGGGIGLENFTLNYLYEEYNYKNNIWTASNKYKDLCRYTGTTINLFRHPETDFVVSYSRQPPHVLNKYTYPSCHPQMLLLDKHKKVILSAASKANSKYKTKIKIKPPKQMSTKWFFTKDFAKYSLFTLKASAANFRYSQLSNKNQNMLVNIYSLNPAFFQIPNWANAAQPTGNGYYRPYATITVPLEYTDAAGSTKKIGDNWNHLSHDQQYYASVNIDTGWFNKSFLQAKVINTSLHMPTATKPMTISRYNPNKDSGEGNEIYVVSTFAANWKQQSDTQFTITGLPLWLGLYGYISFINQMKPSDYIKTHVVVLKSPAIYCYPEIGSCEYYIPIDYDYITGKKPYQLTITDQAKKLWYPSVEWQMITLNAIVESGPFIPKYSQETNSTWELKYNYTSYFKWGGPEVTDKEVKNPKDLNTYDVPDTLETAIQIVNPEKQAPETLFHPWDYRRGVIKETAIKRMCENLSTDTEFQCSPEKIRKKKERVGAGLQNPQKETQKMQAYLQCLCEENICQDSSQQDLQQLINQQQEQQQRVKYSILKLLLDLKKKQRAIQYHTGLLE
nr:MAG: ORF1 [Torque teno midi virus]